MVRLQRLSSLMKTMIVMVFNVIVTASLPSTVSQVIGEKREIYDLVVTREKNIPPLSRIYN